MSQYEMTADADRMMADGSVVLTEVAPSAVSGHLEGTVGAGLFRLAGELPWDQEYTVEALAFREIAGPVSVAR